MELVEALHLGAVPSQVGIREREQLPVLAYACLSFYIPLSNKHCTKCSSFKETDLLRVHFASGASLPSRTAALRRDSWVLRTWGVSAT